MSVNRFQRIFDTLELLLEAPEGMTVTEIGTALALPISSTHNMLQSLVEVDAVSASPGPRYSIGPRAVRLGLRVVDGLDVRMIARRNLQELARATNEDIYLAVRHGRSVVYVDRIQGRRSVTVDIRLGQSLFLHATSVGKLFSAYEPNLKARLLREARPKLTPHTLTTPSELETELSRILREGVAYSREEAVEGIVGFAVPVRDARGGLAAAIHISALKAQINPRRETELLAAARNAADSLESDLGRVRQRRERKSSTSEHTTRPRPRATAVAARTTPAKRASSSTKAAPRTAQPKTRASRSAS